MNEHRDDQMLSGQIPRQLDEIVRQIPPPDGNINDACVGSTGSLGDISDLSRDGDDIPNFIPKRQELSVLLKYWMTQIIENQFFVFCYEGLTGSTSGARQAARGIERIAFIEAFLGSDEVARLIEQAYDEYGRQQDPEAWRIFLHGTPEEVEKFRNEVEACFDRYHSVTRE